MQIKDEDLKVYANDILKVLMDKIPNVDNPEILRDLYDTIYGFLDYWDQDDAWGTEGWNRDRQF